MNVINITLKFTLILMLFFLLHNKKKLKHIYKLSIKLYYYYYKTFKNTNLKNKTLKNYSCVHNTL